MNARVLLVSENPILRDGLESVLLREEGIRSVHCAADAERARMILSRVSIDVAIIDLEPSGVGAVGLIDTYRRRKRPVRCVALASRPTRMGIEQVMQAGTAGIVSTRSSASSLGEAIRRVHGGRCYISADITRMLMELPEGNLTPGHRSGPLLQLTARERDIVRGIAQGWSSREIAERFGISTRTVETHRGRVMRKLNLRKTAALVRFAVREGIVSA